jgi:hypothetical protein
MTFYHWTFIVLLVIRVTGLGRPSAALILSPLIVYFLLWMYSEGSQETNKTSLNLPKRKFK